MILRLILLAVLFGAPSKAQDERRKPLIQHLVPCKGIYDYSWEAAKLQAMLVNPDHRQPRAFALADGIPAFSVYLLRTRNAGGGWEFLIETRVALSSPWQEESREDLTSDWPFVKPQIKVYRGLISEEKGGEIHQHWEKMLMGVRPAIPEETAMPLLGNPLIYYVCHTARSGLLAGEDRGFLVAKDGELQKNARHYSMDV
jgi:hypothetical protein